MSYKYSEPLTKSLNVLSNCNASIKDFEDILKTEGCDVLPSPFNGENIEVVDGDELEACCSVITGRGLGNKNKSVDVIFGVQDDSDSKLTSFVFVELKFRSKTFTKLDKESLVDKVKCSSTLTGTNGKMYTYHFIVFSKKKQKWGRHYLFRTNPILNSSFKAIDIEKLYNLFFT